MSAPGLTAGDAPPGLRLGLVTFPRLNPTHIQKAAVDDHISVTHLGGLVYSLQFRSAERREVRPIAPRSDQAATMAGVRTANATALANRFRIKNLRGCERRSAIGLRRDLTGVKHRALM